MVETPMMQQYQKIKQQHKDAILFFRLGDFYEMFYEDAEIASRECSLTLTGRGKGDRRIPMCGVPFHAAENYISKLVIKGYKVAICEQFDDNTEAKGPTPRDVVRIITPGTAQLESVIDSNTSNYLVALCQVSKSYGLAYVDISTGEFKCDVYQSLSAIKSEVYRLETRELLIDDTIKDQFQHDQKNSFFPYSTHQSEAVILKHFDIKSLAVFKIDHLSSAFPAIAAILDYLNYTQKGAFSQVKNIMPATRDKYCYFDQGVIKHLNLFDKKVGLFSLLDQTNTSMGARKLKNWVRYPLIDRQSIQTRQQKVTQLLKFNGQHKWLEIVKNINDIERLLAKICTRYDNPKDMLALKQSLHTAWQMSEFLIDLGDSFHREHLQLSAILEGENSLSSIYNRLSNALCDEVPSHCRDGGVFKATYDDQLEALCDSFHDIRIWIKELEPKLREALDIKSLKVGFNKVFGYYIEVPNSQKDKVPDTFIRKQTLANAERFITSELKEKETIILNAKEQQAQLEKQLYADLINSIERHVTVIQAYADLIAEIDALQSLAESANKYQLSCPTIFDDQSNQCILKGLWHPMVAQFQTESFIRNDVALTNEIPFMLITGPNMAGKSTVMRSVALCIIMGQMGGYVPAEMAQFTMVESIYTRIGAADKLSEGQSTFMVEMVETATICQNATSSSLILLDEIGRGTSTFDGVSIAASVSEYLVTHIKARTLFATHYHELTALSDKYPEIKTASMQIKEDENKLVFTYKLISGTSEKSYGVRVAKMAGLPQEVISKAEEWLAQFEQKAASGEIVQLQLF